MSCDMCGSDGPTRKGLVEGTEMKLCPTCLKFATKVIHDAPKYRQTHRSFKKKEEAEIAVVLEYSRIIKQAREKTGKKQEDIAKELNIKESLLSHFESGKAKPSIKLAKKLERYFHIRLITKVQETEIALPKNTDASGITLGDLFKKK